MMRFLMLPQISNYYRSKVSGNILSPQDIKNGIVQIKITEAKLEKCFM